jgi:hypothetical protein
MMIRRKALVHQKRHDSLAEDLRAERARRRAAIASDPRVQAFKQALKERRRKAYENAKVRRRQLAEERKRLRRERKAEERAGRDFQLRRLLRPGTS